MHHLFLPTCFAFFQRFSTTKDRLQPFVHQGLDLCFHLVVRVAKPRPALAVPHDGARHPT